MSTLFAKRRNPVLEGLGQLLLLASLVIAVVYGGGWYPAEGLWKMIIKGSAVGCIALFVLINIRSLNHLFLFLALAASVGGDVFLAIEHPESFLRGLMAFLLAHIIFIVLYLKNRLHVQDVSSGRIRIAALLWAVAAIAGYFLYPHLGAMMLPVFSYSVVLAAMATTALLSKYPVKLVGLGALLFVLSDTVLGARQFMTMPDFTGFIVWGTYYLAQLFMTLGIMLADERPTHYGGYRFD